MGGGLVEQLSFFSAGGGTPGLVYVRQVLRTVSHPSPGCTALTTHLPMTLIWLLHIIYVS
jgi:hypothetical protein